MAHKQGQVIQFAPKIVHLHARFAYQYRSTDGHFYRFGVGFAYLLALPPDEVQQLLLRSWRQGIALQDTADPLQVLAHVQAAREAGYASSEDTSYSGTLVIAAPVVGRDNRPQAVLDISVPRSRWTLPELRSELAPVLLAASHAAGRANPTA